MTLIDFIIKAKQSGYAGGGEGRELKFDDGSLIWTMNYYGKVLPSCPDPESVYSFLKEAMLLISPDYPFRGPARLDRQNFTYENSQNGSPDSFHGIESIYENEEKVYVLYYHGGRLNPAL